MATHHPLWRISRELSRTLAPLRFAAPVERVYDPLGYAAAPHRLYLERWGGAPKEVLLLGMNPGPWGMAQTGVPFGEVAMARDFLGVEAAVGKPRDEHPARPVEGFACGRSEVSGRRFWGFVRASFGTPEAFFARFFVANYCPLLFLEAGGRNRTPDQLPAAEKAPLLAACDAALLAVVRHLGPRLVVGVGGFAARRAGEALAGLGVAVGQILHPSPASPAANAGWEGTVRSQLASLGVEWR